MVTVIIILPGHDDTYAEHSRRHFFHFFSDNCRADRPASLSQQSMVTITSMHKGILAQITTSSEDELGMILPSL